MVGSRNPTSVQVGQKLKSLLRNLHRSENATSTQVVLKLKTIGGFSSNLIMSVIYNNVILNAKIFNNFVKRVDLFTSSEYNNSVIAKPQNSNKSVKECFYGTINFE